MVEMGLNIPKQRVLPVRAPWCINAATPFLKVCAAEGDPASPTVVTVAAEFGLEYEQSGANSFDHSVKVVHPPTVSECDQTSGPVTGPNQLIRIIFDCGLWVRFMRSYDDDEIVEEAAFDWSELADLRSAWKPGIEAGRRYYWSRWKQTGVCPDPNMYEVERSVWLREVRPRSSDFKHYLMVGHDAYVEVIAKGWKWESIRSLPNF